jgi:hypothetical protein
MRRPAITSVLHTIAEGQEAGTFQPPPFTFRDVSKDELRVYLATLDLSLLSELAHQKKFSLLKFAFDLLSQLTPDIVRSEIELNKQNNARHGNVVRTRAVPNPNASEAAPKSS